MLFPRKQYVHIKMQTGDIDVDLARRLQDDCTLDHCYASVHICAPLYMNESKARDGDAGLTLYPDIGKDLAVFFDVFEAERTSCIEQDREIECQDIHWTITTAKWTSFNGQCDYVCKRTFHAFVIKPSQLCNAVFRYYSTTMKRYCTWTTSCEWGFFLQSLPW